MKTVIYVCVLGEVRRSENISILIKYNVHFTRLLISFVCHTFIFRVFNFKNKCCYSNINSAGTVEDCRVTGLKIDLLVALVRVLEVFPGEVFCNIRVWRKDGGRGG